jgi:hypothetical protein
VKTILHVIREKGATLVLGTVNRFHCGSLYTNPAHQAVVLTGLSMEPELLRAIAWYIASSLK